MDRKKVALEIIENIGGIENIKQIGHCVTRLRFDLVDESLIANQQVESIEGVMGTMKKSGQYQVIIGSDVANVYKEVQKIYSNKPGNKEKEEKKQKGVKAYLVSLVNTVSSCINGVIPAIVGSGMIKIILILLSQAGLSDNSTYKILEVIGDAAFYFLPILLAYTASKKFKTDTVLAITVSAILIHPTLIEMMSSNMNITFLSIPVYSATYTSAVIPPLLATWVLSLVIPLVDKITPSWTKSFLKPAIVLLITVPIVLIIFAPLGAIIGAGLSTIANAAQQYAPWATMMVLSAIMPLLIMTGMHHAFNPIMFAGLASVGFDALYLPAMLAPNFAQGAACLAVALKSKNKSLKSVAMTAAISASLGGITEPAIFGVTLRLKKPFIATLLGSGIAGFFVGLLGVKSYAVAAPGIISMVQFISPDESSNIIYAIVVALISTVVTFILTLVIGFDDIEETTSEKKKVEHKKNDAFEKIDSPIAGKIIPLEEVDDAAFSKKMVGEGLAIIPDEGKVIAPFDGKVKVMFQTGHAIGLESDSGIEVLIHVGLDTVKMEGEGFFPKVKTGDRVSKGQLLLEFDIEKLREKGYDLVTPVVITNLSSTGKTLSHINKEDRVESNNMIFEVQ